MERRGTQCPLVAAEHGAARAGHSVPAGDGSLDGIGHSVAEVHPQRTAASAEVHPQPPLAQWQLCSIHRSSDEWPKPPQKRNLDVAAESGRNSESIALRVVDDAGAAGARRIRVALAS